MPALRASSLLTCVHHGLTAVATQYRAFGARGRHQFDLLKHSDPFLGCCYIIQQWVEHRLLPAIVMNQQSFEEMLRIEQKQNATLKIRRVLKFLQLGFE